MAEKMNALPKVVFSRMLKGVSWRNSRLAGEDAAGEVRRLREQPGKDIIILASSDLAARLAEEGLIDEYQIMVNPVLLGRGKPVFAGLARDVSPELLATRTFGNGNVLLTDARARVSACARPAGASGGRRRHRLPTTRRSVRRASATRRSVRRASAIPDRTAAMVLCGPGG